MEQAAIAKTTSGEIIANMQRPRNRSDARASHIAIDCRITRIELLIVQSVGR
jgi:hypothetical protein